MNFTKFQKHFEEKLFQACVRDVNELNIISDKDAVFAYSVYLPNGFKIFSSAACNHEGIKNALSEISDENISDRTLKIETSVDYWNIYEPGKSFDEVNEICSQIFDELYDIEDPEEYIQAQDDMIDFFCNGIINTMLCLKNQNKFTSPPFEKDILMGLQYNSPADVSLEIMLNISKKVNSPEWHKKMLEAYQQ